MNTAERARSTDGDGGKGSGRRVLVRAIVVACVIGMGVISVHGLETALGLHFDKPAMPLRENFSFISKELGEVIPGSAHRYAALRDDQSMPEDQIPVLGTRDYLLRGYTDLSKSAEDPTALLNVNLNYYATGSATPHVPETCWAGNGMEEASALSRREFEVPNVPRADGSVITLRMRMISFWAPGSKDPNKMRNVAYTFHVNGDYVATPQEVTSRFWKASNKYAYHAKIEVSVGYDGQMGPDGVLHGGAYCSQDEAKRAISDFIRAALPEIEKCLPDPRAAEGGAAASAAGAP